MSFVQRFGLAAAAMAVAMLPTSAPAQEWEKLAEITRDVSIEGQQVKLVVRPESRFTNAPDNKILAELRAYARLDELQDKAPTVLHKLAGEKSSCETRWSFPSLAPVAVADGRLKLSGQVRVEKWTCKVIKTKLVQETADFRLALYPVNNTSHIAMKADLEHFDLGKSLIRSLEGEIRGLIAGEIAKSLARDDMRFAFPPKISSLNPRFTAAEIRDAGSGKGELYMQAAATIGAAELGKLLAIIAEQKPKP
jgi:hypothetical protein